MGRKKERVKRPLESEALTVELLQKLDSTYRIPGEPGVPHILEGDGEVFVSGESESPQEKARRGPQKRDFRIVK